MTVLLWLGLISLAFEWGLWALAVLAGLQAGAMALGAWLAVVANARDFARIADLLAAGLLLAGAAVYLVPGALRGHIASGALGMVAGLALGLVLQCGNRISVHESMLASLSLHGLSAGVLLGMVYGAAPAVGLSLALAIVAHKLPAGYALAGTLRDAGGSCLPVALPACSVGLTSLPIALWQPRIQLPPGLMFGVASGLFLAVGHGYIGHHMATSRHSLPCNRRAAATGALVGAAVLVGLFITWL